MNKDKPFGYSAVAKYIGNKFIAELWQQKYTIISTILFSYISSVSGENNDDIEQREKQSFDNSFSNFNGRILILTNRSPIFLESSELGIPKPSTIKTLSCLIGFSCRIVNVSPFKYSIFFSNPITDSVNEISA